MRAGIIAAALRIPPPSLRLLGVYNGSTGADYVPVVTSGVDLGEPSPTRTIVVSIAWVTTGGNRGVRSGWSIAGVPLNMATAAGSAQGSAALYYASVPNGTTGDLITTWNAVGGTWQASIYAIDIALGLTDAASASADGTDQISLSLPAAAADDLMAAAAAHNGGGVMSISGVTVDVGAGTNRATGFGPANNSVTATLAAPATAAVARMAAASFKLQASFAMLDHGSPSSGPPRGTLSWRSDASGFWLPRPLPKLDADGYDVGPFFDLVIATGEQGLPVVAYRADTGQQWLIYLVRTVPFSDGVSAVTMKGAPADFSVPAPAGTRWTFTAQEP